MAETEEIKVEEKTGENSYKSILKGTSLFGGVQIFQIAVNLIRGKFVALFLGPAGMGVSSLFNTSSQTIQQFAGFGLNLAIVKEVAAKKDDPESLHRAISVAKTLVLITGLIGALISVVFALPLSRITFGSEEYYWQFVLLGGAIFLGISGQGYLSILQGLHEIKIISTTSIAGSLSGLLIGVPLYAIYGVKGIVPALIALTATIMIANLIGIKKAVPKFRRTFVWQSHKHLVKKLISLGIVLMASDGIGTACNYLINLFIRYFGELENVGLYQAANSITNQYAGFVFMAMSMDFFPRLTAVAEDNEKMREVMNRQLEIVSLLATPMLCLLVVGAPLIIEILLTDKFTSILPLMRWLGMGVLIKALMIPLGFVSFAKDNKTLFFLLEGVFCNVLTLALSCLFYKYFGLIGLGYSLTIDCAICFLVYYLVNARFYGYRFNRMAMIEIGIALLLGAGCFAASFIENIWVSYGVMSVITAITIVRSVVSLKKRLR